MPFVDFVPTFSQQCKEKKWDDIKHYISSSGVGIVPKIIVAAFVEVHLLFLDCAAAMIDEECSY